MRGVGNGLLDAHRTKVAVEWRRNQETKALHTLVAVHFSHPRGSSTSSFAFKASAIA